MSCMYVESVCDVQGINHKTQGPTYCVHVILNVLCICDEYEKIIKGNFID